MLNSRTNSHTKDALERLNNWVNVLERRFYALLDTNDPELMTPAQREQAASRYLMILCHFLQLHQKFAASIEDEDNPALIDALTWGTRELTNVGDTPIQDGQ